MILTEMPPVRLEDAPAPLARHSLARRAANSRALLPALALLAALGVGLLVAVQPLIGIGVALALPVLAIVMGRPEIVTLCVLALIYSNAPVILVRQHGVPAALGALVPMALLIPVLHRALVRRQPLWFSRATPLVVFFGAIMAMSSLTSRDLAGTVGEVSSYVFEGLGIFVLVSTVLTTRTMLRRALWAVLLTGAVLGAFSVYQQVTGSYSQQFFGFAQISDSVIPTDNASVAVTNADGQIGVPRLAGPIGEKNRYAQILVVLVPIGLALLRVSRRRSQKLLALACTGLVTAGMVLTYSRGAALGLVAALVLAAGLRLVPARGLVAFLIAASLAVVALPSYRERLASLDTLDSLSSGQDAGSVDGSIRGRATENLAALLAFREHPILGVGPGAFPSVYQSYAERVGGRPRLVEREAHNLYLGIAAELGGLGLLCFLAIVGILLKDLWRVRRSRWEIDRNFGFLATGLIVALTAYLLTGVFLHLSYQRYFWLLLGLCAAAVSVARAQDSRRGDLPQNGNGNATLNTS